RVVVFELPDACGDVEVAAGKRRHHLGSQSDMAVACETPGEEEVAGADIAVAVLVDDAGGGETRGRAEAERGGRGRKGNENDAAIATRRSGGRGSAMDGRTGTETALGWHGASLDRVGGCHAAFGPARVRRRHTSLDAASLSLRVDGRKRIANCTSPRSKAGNRTSAFA